ncbi:hypothetical protein CKF46_37550, partial [Klebsiella pneumoniae]
AASATSAQKAALSKLSPEMVSADTLAGDPITAQLQPSAASATSAQKAALSKLSPEMVSADTLAGDPITA